MGYVDVLIPALGGLFFLAVPQLLLKPSGDKATDAAGRKKLRIVGVILLLIAGLYLAIKLVSA